MGKSLGPGMMPPARYLPRYSADPRPRPISRHYEAGLWVAALFYLLALVLVSLFPFQGWTWSQALPWDFLWQPLPRYRTEFDLWTNILAYIPLGLLWASLLAVRRQSSLVGRRALPLAPMVQACLLGLLLSLVMEGLQTYLPSRRAQWLDLLANGVGTALGVVLWAAGHYLSRWHRARQRPFRGAICALPLPGSWLVGSLLLIVWVFAQASPQLLWLALGDALSSILPLRPWAWAMGLPQEVPLTWTEQLVLEAFLVSSGLITLAVIGRTTLLAIGHRWSNRLQQQWGLTLGLTIAVALLVRAVWIWLLAPGAQASPEKLQSALAVWLSPGVQTGIFLAGLGGAAAFVLSLQSMIRLVLVLTCLGVVLASGLPNSGYEASLASSWASGQWFNLRGLAALSAAVWPFLVLAWLSLALVSLRQSSFTHYP
jgi:VanZ family protein